MVKKAEIDILEIIPVESDGGKQQVAETASKENQEGPEGGISGEDYASKIMRYVHKPLCWVILVSMAYLGSVAGILIDYYQNTDGASPPAVQKKQDVAEAPFPEPSQGVFLEGIVVDQKDRHDIIKIVFCDVALELENCETANTIADDRIDVKNAIHAVLEKADAEEGLSPEGRVRLKEKLRTELNGLLGENMVKNVYFMNYEMD
jgi:flagellar basal body-associated protein FliL